MNNNLLRLRITDGLNKLSSNDFDNIECWQIAQAFNEEQLNWASELSERGEQSGVTIDSIEKLLVSQPIKGINKDRYFETVTIPSDLMRMKKVQVKAKHKSCSTPKSMVVYDVEEANVDVLLKDENKKPSFEWRETFKTQLSNKIRVYTNGEFTIDECIVVYYRKPKPISFENCVDENNMQTSDSECEFKDDIITRQLIPRCRANLAGSMENFNQVQRNIQTIT